MHSTLNTMEQSSFSIKTTKTNESVDEKVCAVHANVYDRQRLQK